MRPPCRKKNFPHTNRKSGRGGLTWIGLPARIHPIHEGCGKNHEFGLGSRARSAAFFDLICTEAAQEPADRLSACDHAPLVPEEKELAAGRPFSRLTNANVEAARGS